MSQKNNPLELYVANKFKKIGYDKCRPSKGSGAVGERGDIHGQDLFTIECKLRNTKNITIMRDVWYKLLNEIPYQSKTYPLYILENTYKDRYAVMNFDNFMDIINELVELRKDNEYFVGQLAGEDI